jgi:hypothetical protein
MISLKHRLIPAREINNTKLSAATFASIENMHKPMWLPSQIEAFQRAGSQCDTLRLW